MSLLTIKKRIEFLKIFAQVAPTAGTSGTPSAATSTTPTPTSITSVPKIDIHQLPRFNPNLFSLKPDIINDLNNIANKINQYMFSLSLGKVNFNIVYTNPSISGSEYTNSLKHLTTLAKWLYSVMILQASPYSLQGLHKIGTDLVSTVRSMSFPEPSATNLPTDLITLAQTMLAKIPQK